MSTQISSPTISLASSHTSNDEQLTNVTLALKDLNRSIPPDRQIKMIIFLYSKFSEKSDMLIRAIPQECRQFFYYLRIDHTQIRKLISNSTTMRITDVPCIILIDINDTISTYEGDKSVEIIKTIHSLNRNHQLSKHGPNCQCPAHKQQIAPSISSSVTPLSTILGEAPEQEDQYPSESKRPPRRSPIPDRPPVPRQDDEDMSSLIDDSATRMGGVRSKVRHATRPIDSRSIPEQDPPEVGLSSVRHLPPKGVGHAGMAQSSLKEVPQSNPRPRLSMQQVAGGEVLDDDLDDMLDEDPTLDPQIRSVASGSRNVDKKVSMDSVKKAAMEMQKMRESESNERES